MRKVTVIWIIWAAVPLCLAQAFGVPPFLSAQPTRFDGQVITSGSAAIMRERIAEEKQETAGGHPAGTSAGSEPPASSSPLSIPVQGIGPPQIAIPSRPVGRPAAPATSVPASILDRPGMVLVAPLAQ